MSINGGEYRLIKTQTVKIQVPCDDPSFKYSRGQYNTERKIDLGYLSFGSLRVKTHHRKCSRFGTLFYRGNTHVSGENFTQLAKTPRCNIHPTNANTEFVRSSELDAMALGCRLTAELAGLLLVPASIVASV